MTGIYRRYQNSIEKIGFPIILLLYPLLTVNQGIDVADSTYSLTNFQYFGSMDGTWMVATFLSNVAGWLFMHLPFGGTLLGMKCYTTLVLSAMALMVYFVLRKRIPAPLLFLGEFMALGLCWCPSTILYNYLTYFLMAAGILLLCCGLTGPDFAAAGRQQGQGFTAEDRRRRLCFVAAGVCLGANVAVRMPNVVQAAFILAVWYGIVISDRQKKEAGIWKLLCRHTGWCLLGYIIGFGVPLMIICVRYGAGAYPDMVRTMFAMTDQAVDYKPASMLTGMFGDYGRGLYWLVFAGVCMAAGWLLFAARDRIAAKKNGFTAFLWIGIYAAVFLLLLRFYWGRGMFTFRYYEHDCRSMYYPTVLFLLVTVYVCVYCLAAKKVGREQKIFAALLLVQMFVTPLGSNNKLYPIINNLFLAVPFTLWISYERIRAKRQEKAWDKSVVWGVPFTVLTIFVLVQSIGFHANFVFQDGIWGEPRDTKVELPKKAAGIYTNQQNGALLEELALFVQEENLSGKAAITYGELPGLYYLLDMPPALSTGWPDLKSYRMEEYRRDLAALEERMAAGEEAPVIVVSTPVAAYLSDDGEAIEWFGVDVDAMAADEKLQILSAWISDYAYTEQFGNARYVVYMPQAW